MNDRRHRPQLRRPPPVTLGLVALVVIAAGWLGLRLDRVWRAAAALREDVHAAQLLLSSDIEAIDVHKAVALLHATQRDLAAFDEAAGPFLRLAPALAWIPGYGPNLEAAPTLLEMALNLAAAGETAVEPLTTLLERADEPRLVGLTTLPEATRKLAQARPQLQEALVAVQEARSAREGLDAEALTPRLQGWIAQLDRYLPKVEEALRVALMAPEVLGAEGPRTYLLLVQNEDELRASGGFISGVVQVTVHDGQIEKLPFEDSYAIDDLTHPYPQPPAPLREIMLADLWLFRDSNWSPDFPTAAQKAVELFTISREARIDGVIALNQRAITLLLEPLGPIPVAGVDEPVTSQNVLQVARRAWAPGEALESGWWPSRKDIMGWVLEAALFQLEGCVNREQMVGLGSATLQALREKHLLIYLRDEEAAALLRQLGWDGALGRQRGDTWMVVDVNMGFNKANAVVEERLDYAVDLSDPAQPQATLTVHHRHPVDAWIGPCSQEPRYSPTYAGMTERCYYDYLRVYAPSGASLLRATPHPVPGNILLSGQRRVGDVTMSQGELGRTVFATFLVLRPGEHLETTFGYTLPQAILERTEAGWRYRLTVQKQPGTDAQPLSIALRLPAEAEVVAADPRPAQRDGNVLTYDVDLRTDFQLDVTWQLGPPLGAPGVRGSSDVLPRGPR